MNTLIHYRGVGSHERNDCFIQAVVNSLEVPYADAKEIAIKAGWTKTGLCVYASFETLRSHGFTACILGESKAARWIKRRASAYTYHRKPNGITLATWLKTPEAQTGRYVIGIPRHVFAVVDGCIFDAGKNSPHARINSIYKLI